jgi:hypothetical protein
MVWGIFQTIRGGGGITAQVPTLYHKWTICSVHSMFVLRGGIMNWVHCDSSRIRSNMSIKLLSHSLDINYDQTQV